MDQNLQSEPESRQLFYFYRRLTVAPPRLEQCITSLLAGSLSIMKTSVCLFVCLFVGACCAWVDLHQRFLQAASQGADDLAQRAERLAQEVLHGRQTYEWAGAKETCRGGKAGRNIHEVYLFLFFFIQHKGLIHTCHANTVFQIQLITS